MVLYIANALNFTSKGVFAKISDRCSAALNLSENKKVQCTELQL